MSAARSSRRALWGLTGLAGGGVLLLLRANSLPAGRQNTLCLLRRLTGLPCPGCGLTRAFDRLADGDLPGALAAHPLAPLLAVELVVAWALWGLVAAGRLRPPGPQAVQLLLLGHLGALLALWLGRAATGSLPW
ncbi:MAG: DUF2752 domain-containing protein [Thermoanaerobaculia bacterium]